ncbi:hypothetical protein MFIFM68171_05038 [Madurella fahalii]|uniref:Thioesterase domain-containing protein n=1 Tax=Madurella fahalii TaxID=1157608 RepID=A0ABQ0GAP2_9PEZI
MGTLFETNPALIQGHAKTTDWACPAQGETPLVLIHDGGGTTYSYHLLGDLGRPVYGIFNPSYETGREWEGGIPEMARYYLALIKSVVPKGKIIIGGWSLGGLLSLEVAHLIAVDPENTLDLLGIVMVDSVCPIVVTAPLVPIVPRTIQWSDHTKQETRDRVLRCFDMAREMVMEWEMPRWADEEPVTKEQENKNGEVKTTRNIGQRKTASAGPRPPRVILLRAMEAVPAQGGITAVDTHRGDRLLGWEQYRKGLVTMVMDVPGHHYSIFELENVDAATEAINKACLELEA